MRNPEQHTPRTRLESSGVGAALGLLLLSALVGVTAGYSAAEPVSQQAGQAASTSSAESSTSPSPPELVPNGILVEEGLLVGGQPSAEQLAELREAGYVTVINLRTEGEEGETAADVEGMGMTYVALPISGADDLSEENARALAETLAQVEKPALLHCGSGNRVGGLLALKAYYVDGASIDEAIQYGLDSGLTRLEGAVRERLEEADENPHD